MLAAALYDKKRQKPGIHRLSSAAPYLREDVKWLLDNSIFKFSMLMLINSGRKIPICKDCGHKGMLIMLGVSAGTIAKTAAEIIDGLSGSMIADLAMTLAIENGIEKPYRDIVRNTENLREAAGELERLSRTMFKSQVVFTKYVEADVMLEKEFQTQMRRVDEAGKRAMDVINRIYCIKYGIPWRFVCQH